MPYIRCVGLLLAESRGSTFSLHFTPSTFFPACRISNEPIGKGVSVMVWICPSSSSQRPFAEQFILCRTCVEYLPYRLITIHLSSCPEIQAALLVGIESEGSGNSVLYLQATADYGFVLSGIELTLLETDDIIADSIVNHFSHAALPNELLDGLFARLMDGIEALLSFLSTSSRSRMCARLQISMYSTCPRHLKPKNKDKL